MFDSEYEKVNFDENIEGQCKIGWLNSFECVVMSFSVITNYGDPNSLFEYRTKDTVYEIPQSPLVIYIGNNGIISLSRFIDLRSDYLQDKICGVPNDIQEVQEERKIELKNESKIVKEDKAENKIKATFEVNNEKKPNNIENKSLFTGSLLNSGTNNSNISANPFGKVTENSSKPEEPLKFNLGITPEKKTEASGKPIVEALNPFAPSKKDSINPFSVSQKEVVNPFGVTQKSEIPATSLFTSNVKTDISSSSGPANLQSPPKSGFFLSGTGPKQENINISGPLLAGKELAFSPSKNIENQSKLPSNQPSSLFSTISESELKSKSLFPNSSNPVSNPSQLFIKPGETAQLPLNSALNPQGDINKSAESIFKKNESTSKLNELNLTTPASSIKPESQNLFSLSSNKPPNNLNLKPSDLHPGSTGLFSIPENPQKPFSDPSVVKKKDQPESTDKIATISSNKISEQDDIMQMFLQDMNLTLNKIDSNNLEGQLKIIEGKSMILREKFEKLKDKYLENTERTNILFDNLDEINSGIHYITQIWEIQQNSSSNEDALDVNLIKAIENDDKSIKLLEKYLKNGVDKVIGSYKAFKEELGLFNSNSNSASNWKKTRTYAPIPKEIKAFTQLESKNIIKGKIEHLKSIFKMLKDKSSSLNKLLRKKQQRVYNLSIEENSDEEIFTQNSSTFVDPNEYKKAFECITKGKSKKLR